MKTTMLRTIPATLAVLVITAGAATAAVATSDRAPEGVDASIEREVDDDGSGRLRDDGGTSEERTSDGRCSPSDDDRSGSASEGRPLRREEREDRERREVRAETRLIGSHTYPVAQAGSVTVAREDAALTVTDVVPGPGWTSHIERSGGYDVEVTFRHGGQRVDFTAEIEHDLVKTRVRER